jgi:CBS domain-containing protein
MTADVACCTPDTNLQEVARLMAEHDCGAIPVVEDRRSKKPVGVVTDRDITTRAVAQGKNPLQMTARDVMSGDCCTVSADASLKDCCGEMESHQVRRMIVTDERGGCCGIVAQADIALRASKGQTGEVVREVSQPATAGAA